MGHNANPLSAKSDATQGEKTGRLLAWIRILCGGSVSLIRRCQLSWLGVGRLRLPAGNVPTCSSGTPAGACNLQLPVPDSSSKSPAACRPTRGTPGAGNG